MTDKMKNEKIVMGITALIALLFLAGCSDAGIASENLVRASDNFEINRRIVFFNGITDKYLLTIEGRCAVFSDRVTNGELEVICKTGDGQYKKHFLGLSDNVAYFVEQIEPVEASAYHYRVIFKPQAIIPDVDIKIDMTDLPRQQD